MSLLEGVDVPELLIYYNICVCVCVCVYIFVCLCVCVYVYIYMCVYIYVCVYIYIYIFFAFETFTTSVKSKHPASEPELSPSSRRAQHKHFVHLSVTHAQHTARHIVCHPKYFLSGKTQR